MIDLLMPLAIFNAQDFFEWFVRNAMENGYLLVFIFMVIESSFIPFPSEVIVPPAAYIAVTTGCMNIPMIVVSATAGALGGAIINYYLSVWIGRPVVYSFADSHIGHACLIDRAKVENAERYFDKHGAISTLVGRLIPAVRQLISIPAGLARMNIGKFMLYTSLGAAIWNCVLAGLGYWLGKTYNVGVDKLYELVEKYNDNLTYVGYGIGIVCVLVIVYNVVKKRRDKKAEDKNAV